MTYDKSTLWPIAREIQIKGHKIFYDQEFTEQ